jgi:hypothetical protein
LSLLIISAAFFPRLSRLAAVDAPIAPPINAPVERSPIIPEPPFPGLYTLERMERLNAEERAQPYWVPSESEAAAAARRLADYRSLLLNDDVVAFYGSPLSKRMGILGRYPMHELDGLLSQAAQDFDQANGDRGVRKAFYIIYGMAWPEGEIGILRDSRLIEYIEFALERNILVFIDHQIGKYGVVDSLKKMLPYLRYPNVHLALDPEWRTLYPMAEIGSVKADELNEAQRAMEEYILAHGIPGERMLVVHQFHFKMIADRERVRSDFSRVRLVHCADGFGVPALKRMSYGYNATAGNIPVKGFKLFYKSDTPGAGFDEPLMTPSEVFGLIPRPYVVMYQ